MLESMTALQYREWLAFFKIRNERDDNTSREGQQRLYGNIFRAMTGYQQRQDSGKTRWQ